VSLKPGEVGTFEVRFDDELLYSMLETGDHVEFNVVRDVIYEKFGREPPG
jgi:hypothetical protein